MFLSLFFFLFYYFSLLLNTFLLLVLCDILLFGSKMYCCLFLFLEIFCSTLFLEIIFPWFCSLIFQCHVHFYSLMYNNIFLHLNWFLFPDVQHFVSLFIEICSSCFRKLVPQISLFLGVYFCSLEVHFVLSCIAFYFFIQKDLFLLFLKNSSRNYFVPWCYFCSLSSSFLFPDVQHFISLSIEICSSYFRKLVPQIILFLDVYFCSLWSTFFVPRRILNFLFLDFVPNFF
jgi:hypothetical protein